MNNFWDFLKNTLTAHEYENLAESINCGPKRLTRIENGTTDFRLPEILKLAEVMNIPADELIMLHGVGKKNISLEDMDDMLALEGRELRVVSQAS